MNPATKANKTKIMGREDLDCILKGIPDINFLYLNV